MINPPKEIYMITLYHYLHCPFCVRIRLALGLLKVPYKSVVLDYSDEQTPIELCGKKMLPLIKNIDGTTMNESLDIIKVLDKNNRLNPTFDISDLINELGSFVHPLAMPYFIYTPEFNDSSRKYFQDKKESYKGPFKDLYKDRQKYTDGLNKTLNSIELKLDPFYESDKIQLEDILIASHLWGMYIVPEFQFSEKIHLYLQNIKHLCDFEYHKESWE